MNPTKLTILFSSEVLPWERKAIEGVTEHLARKYPFTLDEISPSKRSVLNGTKGTTWIISNHWRETLKFVGAYETSSPIFVSIIHPTHYHPSWYQMLLNKMVSEIPRHIEFVVHSEFNLRYLNELEGIPKEKIHYLPFGMPKVTMNRKKETKDFIVGGFSSFESESNLSHVMSIAHYLKHKAAGVKIRIFGTGELYRHLKVQIWELGLEDTLDIIETNDVGLLSEVDLLLHLPIRQDHFLSILFAAEMGIPVVASEGLGVHSYLTDSKDGFILPINDTKSFGELIERFAEDRSLGETFGSKLKSSLSEKYSWAKILNLYETLFFKVPPPPTHPLHSRAA